MKACLLHPEGIPKAFQADFFPRLDCVNCARRALHGTAVQCTSYLCTAWVCLGKTVQ